MLRAVALLTALFVGACADRRGQASNASEVEANDSSHPADQLALDLTSPRLCTVTAYESATEPTKFPVGAYAVSSVSTTTPSPMPLSKFLRSDDSGRPTDAHFAIYFRRSATQSANLLTPYTPLPLASDDGTSMIFATPPDTPGDDRSKLTVTAPSGSSVALQFDEIVHGHPGRTMTVECDLG